MTSTAPALDARDHAAAVKAAIKAQLGAAWNVYDYDDVPGGRNTADEDLRRLPLPRQYVVLGVERRSAPPLRQNTGRASRSSWRVVAVGVGTSVDEARWMVHRIDQALDGAQLTIDGQLSSPLVFELSEAPQPDDGRFSGRTQYVYTT